MYIGIALLTGMLLSKEGMQDELIRQVHSALDMPLALVLILYCSFTVYLEASKSKYRTLIKNKDTVKAIIIAAFLLIAFIFVFVKYFL